MKNLWDVLPPVHESYNCISMFFSETIKELEGTNSRNILHIFGEIEMEMEFDD